jgi:hypothetical protein
MASLFTSTVSIYREFTLLNTQIFPQWRTKLPAIPLFSLFAHLPLRRARPERLARLTRQSISVISPRQQQKTRSRPSVHHQMHLQTCRSRVQMSATSRHPQEKPGQPIRPTFFICLGLRQARLRQAQLRQARLRQAWPMCVRQGEQMSLGRVQPMTKVHVKLYIQTYPNASPVSENASPSSSQYYNSWSPRSSTGFKAWFSSQSSDGLGPFYGARKYTLFMLTLRSVSLGYRPASESPIISAAARKALKVIDDLPDDHSLLLCDVLAPTGMAVDDFWRFWTFCRGCKFIVAASAMPDHICDLTVED